MPLSRQQLPSTGQEDAVWPRLRAAAFDVCAPVTRRAAAPETLSPGPIGSAATLGGTGIGHSLPKVTGPPGLWSSTSWRRTGGAAHSPRCSVMPEATLAFGQVTKRAPATAGAETAC
jgi:hypothetical protein